MKTARLTVPFLLVTGALTLSGCGALTEDGSAAAEDSRTIAVALYPLEYVAARVAGDGFDVENLTTPGGEPHDLSLTITQTATVADSALLVYVDSLQPDVDAAADEVATGQVLDAATVVDLLPFAEEEGHEDETEEVHEDHDHGEYDPHFWQDPLRMADLGDAIADELTDIDPDRTDTFTANAADLRSDLEALDGEYAAGLADCAITTVVTNHDAFGYLEKYGLQLESITGISPEAEPTPAALADLQELIEADGVTTVFSESLVSPKNAETLANDLGVTTEVLDTIEGLTDDTADEDYLALMRQNLAKLEQANRC
jgi:zinc transport system substrate-binding protein